MSILIRGELLVVIIV